MPSVKPTSFNSTMVRLKELYYKYIDRLNVFQFHNGSIKSKKQARNPVALPQFQFHNGSIKSMHGSAFDSDLTMFQFHNGSIKRKVGSLWYCLRVVFQFHNGSIKSPKNQLKILYKTRTISTRRKLSLGSKVVNVQLCKINGRLTRSRGYASNP